MKSLRSMMCRILMGCVAVLPFHNASAGMIATPAADRDTINAFLERGEVQAQLAALGVEAGAAQARVAALSDEEAAVLAAKVREAPAGGNASPGLVVFIIVVIIGFLICSAELVVAGKKPAFCF